MGKNRFFVKYVNRQIKILKYTFVNFFSVFYPTQCSGCGADLNSEENLICSRCILDLPYTLFDSTQNNAVWILFEGRIINLFKTYSLCYFIKHSQLQSILHSLKYRRLPQLGYELGIYLGYEMKNIGFDDFDIIIPIPLHLSRLKVRGYNQSEMIARGICEVINAKIDTKSIVRAKKTQTQTKKSKNERWQNVQNIFKIKYPKKLQNKHILIVDDVITTGSTIESLANLIESEIENVKISIASIAIGKRIGH